MKQKHVLHRRMNLLLKNKKKESSKIRFGVVVTQVCGSGILVFSGQHEGCSMRDGSCMMYATLCPRSPKLARKQREHKKIMHQDDTFQQRHQCLPCIFGPNWTSKLWGTLFFSLSIYSLKVLQLKGPKNEHRLEGLFGYFLTKDSISASKSPSETRRLWMAYSGISILKTSMFLKQLSSPVHDGKVRTKTKMALSL